MLDKEKSNTHYQELITACVSHELRNPLNSISSSNIEKAFLYDEIDVIIKAAKE
jgi:signal transduction histidine kinase